MLDRMRSNPSPLYLREIVQGTGLKTAVALDAVNELHELGLVLPASWRVTPETVIVNGPSGDTTGIRKVVDTSNLSEPDVQVAEVVELHPSRARRRSRPKFQSIDHQGGEH